MKAGDYREAVWKRFEADMQARLDELRSLNDAPTRTHEQTMLIRGQISEVKRILALSKGSAGASVEPDLGWPLQHDV